MSSKEVDPSKRDFLGKVTLAVTGIGAAATTGMFIGSMLPTAEVAAQSSVEIDISDIAEGTGKTVAWQGNPIFIVHRTKAQIDKMQAEPGGKEPQPDQERVQKPNWLVLIGTCTHMGCVPNLGAEGWFCPCHGSKYDMSGRIISGPAPKNLHVPPYKFLADTKILIGKV